jgi:hypothetical protein
MEGAFEEMQAHPSSGKIGPTFVGLPPSKVWHDPQTFLASSCIIVSFAMRQEVHDTCF